jgi:hypothetical protein
VVAAEAAVGAAKLLLLARLVAVVGVAVAVVAVLGG